jgi:toxin ParE1/3/4
LAYRVLWSDSAQERITKIFDFIAEKNPTVARRVVEDLLDRVEALAAHPRLGRPLSDEMEVDLRRLVLGDYVIVYRLQETRQTVLIIAVRHHRERSLPGEEV